VSSITPELVQNCPRCAKDIPPGALECPLCHTLVYGDTMEQLAAHARSLEAHGDLQEAREKWLACLPLLPPKSTQAQWVRDHARQLELGASQSAPQGQANPQAAKPKWVKWLGPLAPVALLLAKFSPVIFKLPFLLSFMAFLGVYWSMWGAKLGIGIAVLVLIHEMGHFIDIKRRGLPADMPVFLPGLGAYVRWQAIGVTLETRAAISLAGPLAGWLAAVVCALIWHYTGNAFWAALARLGAWFNALNLSPLPLLDGGSATFALSKVERGAVLVVSAALAYALRDWVFCIVAAGAAWRLFTRDAPPEPSNSTTAYYLAVLTGLALVMWLVPGHGSGLP
jgi:Zn-dependent protease